MMIRNERSLNMILNRLFKQTIVLGAIFCSAFSYAEQTTLLNVSYDVARELYKRINPAFIQHWQDKTGQTIQIRQSHGGSSKQAGAVIGGLEADVITMNQAPDIDILVTKGDLVSQNWRELFPDNAAPYVSTMVFLVRKGNPKNIKDWDDLVRPGMEVILPNPKVTGNGRYSYLAAWGYGLEKQGTEQGAREFVKKLFANVPVLDGGGRGATTTFTQRDIGDVLVTFENEAILITQELADEKGLEIVYPSLSIEAQAPVAINNPVVDKKKTRDLATAYLNFLWSDEGQEIIAKQYYRPRNQSILEKYQDRYQDIKLFSVEERLGSWAEAQKKHFTDGGQYDQIMMENHR